MVRLLAMRRWFSLVGRYEAREFADVCSRASNWDGGETRSICDRNRRF